MPFESGDISVLKYYITIIYDSIPEAERRVDSSDAPIVGGYLVGREPPERARRSLRPVGESEPVVHHVGGVMQFSHVVHGARRRGIDARGLSREDRAIVRLLIEQGRPVGLEAIVSRLGLDLDTLRDIHEPWLERTGLVERAERGRVATAKARAWYAKPNPGGSSDSGEDSGGPSPPPGPQGAPLGGGSPCSGFGFIPREPKATSRRGRDEAGGHTSSHCGKPKAAARARL